MYYRIYHEASHNPLGPTEAQYTKSHLPRIQHAGLNDSKPTLLIKPDGPLNLHLLAAVSDGLIQHLLVPQWTEVENAALRQCEQCIRAMDLVSEELIEDTFPFNINSWIPKLRPFTMSKIALILGSGARVGQAITTKFLQAGYKVATVSRTTKPNPTDDNIVHYNADLDDPSAIEPIFNELQQYWGAPSVVIYNAAGWAPTPDNPLSAPFDEFAKTLNTNVVTPYAAASIGYARNKNLTFIYTGNALSSGLLNTNVTTAGAGKSAASHWIAVAAQAGLVPATFYYADQRDPEGKPAYGGINGQAHADLYLKLAEQEEQGAALVVFRAPLVKKAA